jgi:hypothetical protein
MGINIEGKVVVIRQEHPELVTGRPERLGPPPSMV